jgi:hypothetical protein
MPKRLTSGIRRMSLKFLAPIALRVAMMTATKNDLMIIVTAAMMIATVALMMDRKVQEQGSFITTDQSTPSPPSSSLVLSVAMTRCTKSSLTVHAPFIKIASIHYRSALA